MKTNIKKYCPNCGKRLKLMAKGMTTGKSLWECPKCKLSGWDGQLK